MCLGAIRWLQRKVVTEIVLGKEKKKAAKVLLCFNLLLLYLGYKSVLGEQKNACFTVISLLMLKKLNWLCLVCHVWMTGCTACSELCFLPPFPFVCTTLALLYSYFLFRFQFSVSKHVLCWQAPRTFTWSKQKFLSTPGILLQPAVQSCCQVLQVYYHLRLALTQPVHLCITELRPNILSWRTLPADACQGACPLFSSKVAVARSYWFSYKGQFGRKFSLHWQIMLML